MNKKYIILLLLPLICGCKPKIDTNLISKEEEEIPTYETTNYYVVNKDEMYKKLYSYENKIEVELDFTNEALRKLQEYGNTKTIQKDMYHPCSMKLKINNEVYNFDEVGARMKGNTSRTNGFVYEDNTLNQSWFLNLKLSFNQTFDSEEDNDYYIREWESKDVRKERKNRRLGGQKKIDLKWNKNFDNTFTKSAYASYAFEQEGIPAQKDNIIMMTIKNETDSVSFLMDMMEAVDETFLTSHLPAEMASGNLYKSLYQSGPADFSRSSLNSVGVETPSWTPIYDLKTNDDEPDHSLLSNLINTLNNDKSDAKEFYNTLDSLVDLDEFIKFSAMTWVVGNPDDMRNNYNNFFTYFRSDNNKVMFFPYDNDRCFGILQDWPIHTEDYAYNSDIQVATGDQLRNPLFYRVFLEGTNYYGQNFEVNKELQTKYEYYCALYAQKYLNVDKFQDFTNKFPLVNKNISKGGGNNITFEKYAEKKLSNSPKNFNFVFE